MWCILTKQKYFLYWMQTYFVYICIGCDGFLITINSQLMHCSLLEYLRLCVWVYNLKYKYQSPDVCTVLSCKFDKSIYKFFPLYNLCTSIVQLGNLFSNCVNIICASHFLIFISYYILIIYKRNATILYSLKNNHDKYYLSLSSLYLFHSRPLVVYEVSGYK